MPPPDVGPADAECGRAGEAWDGVQSCHARAAGFSRDLRRNAWNSQNPKRKERIHSVATPGTSTNPGLDPLDYVGRFETAARRAGFRFEGFGEIAPAAPAGPVAPEPAAPARGASASVSTRVAGFPLVAATRRTPGLRPRIYLSSGIHGDEPAGPLALLDLMERGVFDDRAVWFICPLLNPVGFTLRTRENAEGLDLNRDYRALKSAEIRAHARWLQHQPNFDLALCIHEDWEAKGFYLYELNPTGRPSLARLMREAVCACCPIETATIIDGREISERGIIRPLADPLKRELWPESIYLRAHHTRLSYTLETPSGFPIAQRVAAHAAAIAAGIAALCARWQPGQDPGARAAVDAPG